MDDLNILAALWVTCKNAETAMVDMRRKIEDRILSLGGVPENLKGTETLEPADYIIKITGRIDKKVDSDKLQEIAAENGLTDHLYSLFRWHPEVNERIWKATDAKITRPLAEAITAKPGRPGFKVEKKEWKL